MRVFISMPMNGKSDEQIKEEFETHSEVLRQKFGKSVKIINSIDTSKEEDPIRLLSRSLYKLSRADIVYFASGWQQARGCSVEYNVAKMYGKAVLEELNGSY